MIKNIIDIDTNKKKVILRVDYNVPIKNNNILDTKKIDKSFKTIDYLVQQKAKIIILSHFGRVKTNEDKKMNSLIPVFEYINSLNKYNISFCDEPMGEKLNQMIDKLEGGELLLVENTRFLDVNEKLESGNSDKLVYYWSSLADLYVCDAFGSMHRNHASVTGLAQKMESAVGFLVQEELDNLKTIVQSPKKPFVVVMGGAKLDDKISLIKSLIDKCDYMIFGGGIANTFLKMINCEIGKSIYSSEMIKEVEVLYQKYKNKIILPIDFYVLDEKEVVKYKKIDAVEATDTIFDIGQETLESFKKIISSAKSIFVNGTVGLYEDDRFKNGTKNLLTYMAESQANVIVGGGDAASSVKKFNLEDKVDFISTGGGATLNYISNGTLPAIDALDKY